MKHLSTACWDKRGGGILWCRQTIHLFTVSSVSLLLNTFLTFQWLHSIQKSAKGDWRCLSSPQLVEIHNDPLRTTWNLEMGGGEREGGGGNNACIVLISIGSQCHISVAALANNCFPRGRTAVEALITLLICSEAASERVSDTEKGKRNPWGGRRDALRDCSLDKTPRTRSTLRVL